MFNVRDFLGRIGISSLLVHNRSYKSNVIIQLQSWRKENKYDLHFPQSRSCNCDIILLLISLDHNPTCKQMHCYLWGGSWSTDNFFVHHPLLCRASPLLILSLTLPLIPHSPSHPIPHSLSHSPLSLSSLHHPPSSWHDIWQMNVIIRVGQPGNNLVGHCLFLTPNPSYPPHPIITSSTPSYIC